MPSFTGVSHVAVTVSDVARSRDWYVDVLGCQVLLASTDRPGIESTLLIHADSGLMIGLAAHDGGDRAPFDEKRVGLDHLSFSVPSRDALAEWEQRLSDKGVTHSGIHDVPYGHVLVFRDPDNVQLELFALPAGVTPPA